MPAPHATPSVLPAPAFTAVLFGLSGCLVDFGARSTAALDHTTLSGAARHDIHAAVKEHASATPGALAILQSLNRQGVPCAWLDELPGPISECLAAPLETWVVPGNRSACGAAWPAPDACWQALMTLSVQQLDGCVLISGDPRLLQSGLNAGLWTIGLASCGPLCGLSPSDWQALSDIEREYRRGQATLQLYAQGVHSVIDHLGELPSCLADISLRRTKGEKP
ncbi:MAG: HAD family phosphatase [Pseudomonas sp.]